MSEPIKHHYVPQCYLKRFSSDNKVVVFFDKQIKEYGSQDIREFCQINNLYKLSQSEPYYIETIFFAHDIEDKLGKILSFFDKLDFNMPHINYDNHQRFNLSKQIFIQYIRTPKYRDSKSKNELNAFYSKITQLLKIHFNFEVDEIEFKPDNIAEYHKNILLEDNTDIITNISGAYWELIYSPERKFYTSDNPITIMPRNDMPVTYCDAINYFSDIYYPLNPKLVLHIKAQEALSSKVVGIRHANDKDVTEVNNLISQKATQYIIKSNEYK